MKLIVAIDGPAGAGKGTIASLLANHFDYSYLDTGLLYRAAAYRSANSRKGKDISDISNISNVNLKNLLEIINKIPEEILKSDEMGRKASEISKRSDIREVMTQSQREFASFSEKNGVVLDGRDIGTVVFPNADCKLFVTADLSVRAKRRFHDLSKNNPKITYEEIYDSLAKRDNLDSTRAEAPLVCTEDYKIIDTSSNSVNETIEKAVNAVNEAKRRTGKG